MHSCFKNIANELSLPSNFMFENSPSLNSVLYTMVSRHLSSKFLTSPLGLFMEVLLVVLSFEAAAAAPVVVV